MPRHVKNVAESVRQQLLNRARASNRPFNELLQHFAMERFLYRLSMSPHMGRFVLKGALMMTIWKVQVSRPTMDIDLLGHIANEIETIVDVTKEICSQNVEPDGVSFDPTSVQGTRIAEEAEYGGVRVRFRGSLGTARIVMQLDVGFGDAVIPRPETVDYPTILDLPSARLRGYTRESAIAEKLDTMLRRGSLNSRMRDFFDIWSLSRQFDFDGRTLASAVRETFGRRGTAIHSEPVALTRAFAEDSAKREQWQAFLRKSQLQHAPSDLVQVVQSLALFLAPVLEAIASGRSFERSWKAQGPWRCLEDA